MAFLWAAFIAGGFLLGSVQFCRIIPKLVARKDICACSDDKNPGAYNAFKHCGKKIGALCLFLDVFKGFAPVFAAVWLLDTQSLLFALVMLAPVAGHAVGIFNGFHGGKCISASFGVMLAVIPVTAVAILTLAALYIAFSTVLKINSNRVRSIVVYALFGVISCTACALMHLPALSAGCELVAATVIFKHINFKKFRRAQSEETAENPATLAE